MSNINTYMAVLKLVLFLFLPFLVVNASNNCQTSSCLFRNITIRFPFRLTNQPQNCGYPGFDLNCSTISGVPVLNLPYSGSFLVRDIDYLSQEIRLYDPVGCIASRLLSLNLSASPFKAVNYNNYTLFACPPNILPYYSIRCLSNSTHDIIATSSAYYKSFLSVRCEILGNRPIAVPWLFDFYALSFPDEDDLLLNWDAPTCSLCEYEGGLCGFKNNRNQDIGCYKDPKKGNATGVVIGSIAVITFGLLWLLCYKCTRNTRQSNLQANSTIQISMSTIETEVPRMARGLDNSTIESYPVVILGESCRIPGPNSATCPICLAEYLPQDFLRSIPECEHCFHADCIDEWLHLKSVCPVCRNSPPASVAS